MALTTLGASTDDKAANGDTVDANVRVITDAYVDLASDGTIFGLGLVTTSTLPM